ncbi:MAG: hypothetical protein O4751_07900 [Trichodesmium sp. St2_bin6]|nr:hypothetical protein [Trichodesmium sp. St5_bin8]MDE5078190.1 hypothetical protein [Trichodesmium sp. St2_bin6]MDE5090995.1 hypothetical protein [Trichodesmium sp. St18_bin3_1_1]MDE5102585.1 hypothetical protein [Trichodesmium sp. St19_bin2]
MVISGGLWFTGCRWGGGWALLWATDAEYMFEGWRFMLLDGTVANSLVLAVVSGLNSG